MPLQRSRIHQSSPLDAMDRECAYGSEGILGVAGCALARQLLQGKGYTGRSLRNSQHQKFEFADRPCESAIDTNRAYRTVFQTSPATKRLRAAV